MSTTAPPTSVADATTSASVVAVDRDASSSAPAPRPVRSPAAVTSPTEAGNGSTRETGKGYGRGHEFRIDPALPRWIIAHPRRSQAGLSRRSGLRTQPRTPVVGGRSGDSWGSGAAVR